MHDTDKLLYAFWHKSRKTYLPWCLNELVQRSGLSEIKTTKLIDALIKQNLVFVENVRGERIYYLTRAGQIVLDWKMANEQKKIEGRAGLPTRAHQRVSVGC